MWMLLLCNINESIRLVLFIVDNDSDEPSQLFPDVGSSRTQWGDADVNFSVGREELRTES